MGQLARWFWNTRVTGMEFGVYVLYYFGAPVLWVAIRDRYSLTATTSHQALAAFFLIAILMLIRISRSESLRHDRQSTDVALVQKTLTKPSLPQALRICRWGAIVSAALAAVCAWVRHSVFTDATGVVFGLLTVIGGLGAINFLFLMLRIQSRISHKAERKR